MVVLDKGMVLHTMLVGLLDDAVDNVDFTIGHIVVFKELLILVVHLEDSVELLS